VRRRTPFAAFTALLRRFYDKDREPDQPHGHLGAGWLAGSLADLNYGRSAGASDRLIVAPHVHIIRDTIVLDRGVEIAAATVLLEEGVEIGEKSHPPSLAH
jgi:hypothetical protein